jgi:hypothetical protein
MTKQTVLRVLDVPAFQSEALTLHSVPFGECANDKNKIATWRNHTQVRRYLASRFPHKIVLSERDHDRGADTLLFEEFGRQFIPRRHKSIWALANCDDEIICLNDAAKWAAFSNDLRQNNFAYYFVDINDANHAKLKWGWQ